MRAAVCDSPLGAVRPPEPGSKPRGGPDFKPGRAQAGLVMRAEPRLRPAAPIAAIAGMLRRASRSLRGEEALAGIMSFEAIVIIMLLTVGLAVVPTVWRLPASSHDAVRDDVEAQCNDLLQAWAQMTEKDYDTKLQRVVIENLNRNTTSLISMVKRVLPPGAGVRLTLQGPQEQVVVLYEDPRLARWSVGCSKDVALNWNTALVVPRLQSLDGSGMAQDLVVVPLHNGFPVEEAVPLEVEVETRNAVYRAAASVRQGDVPHVSMYLVDEFGTPAWWWSNTDNPDFTLRVEETQGQPVHAGAVLRVRLPWHWRNISADPNLNAGWIDSSTTQGEDGWSITAKLKNTLQASTMDFVFNGTRPKSDEPGAAGLDHVLATLEDGRTGSTHLIIKGNGRTTTQAGPLAKGSYHGIPFLTGLDQPGQWSITFANPNILAPLGTETVQRVTIRQPDGYPLFQDAEGAGWTVIKNGTTLQWTGAVSVPGDEARSFTVKATPNQTSLGHPNHADLGIAYPSNDWPNNPTAELDGYHHNLTRQPFPGGHEQRVPANATSPGYRLNPPTGLERPLACSDVRIRNHPYRGCAEYNVTNLPALAATSDKTAACLAKSNLTLLNGTHASPGAWITARADFTPCDDALASDPNVVAMGNTILKFYKPWAAKPWTLQRWPTLHVVTATAPNLEVPLQLPEDAPYGAYVVVAEREIDLIGGSDLSQRGPGDTTWPDQVVRMVTMLVVGKTLEWPMVTLYSVGLEVWLPDWQ